MNENLWQIAQIIMWVVGIQTTIMLAVLGSFYTNLNKKIDKLGEKSEHMDRRLSKVEDNLEILKEKVTDLNQKVEDVDRRLCRIEGSLQTHGHCLFNQSKPEQKAQ